MNHTLLRAYYELTKPGIIRGNLFVAICAFFFASHWHPVFVPFLGMVVGLGLVIASGGVFNNYFDRDIDAKMERTKKRPSVTGAVSPNAMCVYGTALGVIGAVTLFFFTNILTFSAALFGLFVYLVPYTLIAKRGSEWGNLVGSVSGAMPPVVGYVAASGQLDWAALILFLMLVFWQMPHAYAIALRRIEDYRAAGIAVLPLVHGIKRTKIEMLISVILFAVVSPRLTTLGGAGVVYGFVAIVVPLLWAGLAVYGFFAPDPARWGKHMFLSSLVVLILLFVVMAIDTVST